MRKSIALTCGALFVLTLPSASQQPMPDSSVIALGRQYTAWWTSRNFSELWKVMGPEMRTALGGEGNLGTVWDQIASQVGKETEVQAEEVRDVQGMKVYLRRTKYDGAAVPVNVQWVMREGGEITGFFIRPAQDD